jgi:tellurite resistance protein TehA-like permease
MIDAAHPTLLILKAAAGSACAVLVLGDLFFARPMAAWIAGRPVLGPRSARWVRPQLLPHVITLLAEVGLLAVGLIAVATLG